jgi:HK97 family phage major capsid protein
MLEVVRRSLLRSVALKFDLAVFEGSGSAPEPRGLRNVPGIQSVSMGANGAALTTLGPIADAIGSLMDSNASAAAIVMHSRTWRALTKIKGSDRLAKPLLQDEAGGVGAAPRLSIYGTPSTSRLS